MDAVFSYNYSAQQNREVQEIRNRYLPKEESKLEELKRLDRKVQTSGQAQALSIGIIGCLIFGTGMCFALGVLGSSMLLGVIIGLVGVLVMLPAYPIYRRCRSKAKAANQERILELAAELSGESK